MNAGTFYKALSYACLYRDETEDADEILNTDTTVTLVREQKTEKLLRQLGEKYELTKHAEGIYRINGMMFPVQIPDVTGTAVSPETPPLAFKGYSGQQNH
ncbi:MAG: hypothetical protein K1W23_05160 [Lachnospiraceae bacterium]